MENAQIYTVTREKHLDHLVRVVPLLALGYGVQCYMLMQMNTPFTQTTLVVLAVALVCMILCFVTYDVHHKVQLHPEHLQINFLNYSRSIRYEEVISIELEDPEGSFSSLICYCRNNQKLKLYFIDDAPKIREWIEARKNSSALAA